MLTQDQPINLPQLKKLLTKEEVSKATGLSSGVTSVHHPSTATIDLPNSLTEDKDDEGVIEKRSSSTSILTQPEGSLKMVMEM